MAPLQRQKTKDPGSSSLTGSIPWIPDQSLSSTFVIGDRGQASRMTDKDKSKTLEP